MYSFVTGASTWLKVPVMIQGKDDQYYISIILEKGSVAFAHFVISDCVNPRFCVPVSSLVDLNYSISKIECTFHDYFEKRIIFWTNESSDIEMFVSQFILCSTMTTIIDDKFRGENADFVNLHSVNSMFPVSETKPNPSVLLPINDKTTYESWRKRNLHLNFSYISKLEDFKMGFLTFNVAQQSPSDVVVPALSTIFAGPRIDVLFVSLQEIDFGAKAVVVGSSDAKDQWTDILRKMVRNINMDYALIKSFSLGGVYTAIFVQPNLKYHFTVTNPILVRLGVGGLMANKSALIFPLHVGETSINVAAAHLAPHVGHNKERLAQLDNIIKQMPKSDYVVIFGDLNFRLLITYEDAVQLANRKDIEKIKETDELLAALNFTNTLKGFTEGPITFLPTYRFEFGSDNYDLSPKKRVPSFTDRVIVKTGEPRISVGPSDKLIFETDIIREKVKGYKFESADLFGLEEPNSNYPIPPECLSYSRLNTKFSDHRPVFALYKFHIPVIDEERASHLKEIMESKKRDALLLLKPIVSASRDNEKIILTNDGACWARWHAKPNGVTMTPSKGIIFPGSTNEIGIVISGDSPSVEIVIEGHETFTFSIT